MFSAADCHALPYSEKIILCSIDRASYYMAIIIQEVATEYSLFNLQTALHVSRSISPIISSS
jgi:hypothetical protein